MRYEIIFPETMFDKLRRHLFEGRFNGTPLPEMDENACIALCGVVRSESKTRYLVRDLDIPGEDEVVRSRGMVRLKPSVYQRLRKRCSDEGLSPMDVHSHPFGHGFFSGPDLNTLDMAGYWFSTIREDCPMPMVVHGATSIAGMCYDGINEGNKISVINEIRVIGHRWQRLRLDTEGQADWAETEAVGRPMIAKGNYHRQMLCWGVHGQRELCELHVAILGVGGIGALAAETLARLGVEELTLVDLDIVSESNLSRLSGAYPGNPFQDGDVGKAKVEVVARHLRRINPDIKLHLYETEFESSSVKKDLALCDILYVAVDTLNSRLAANQLGAIYLIPVLEVGTVILADLDRGMVKRMGCDLTTFIPGTNGCRFCFGERRILEKGAGVQGSKGYVWGTEQTPEPAVLPQNATINALACHQLVKYITGFGSIQDRLHYDGLNESLTKVTRNRNKDCPVCSDKGFLALGDTGTIGTFDAHFEPTDTEKRTLDALREELRAVDKAAEESRKEYRWQQK